jgi:hypothetical protein
MMPCIIKKELAEQTKFQYIKWAVACATARFYVLINFNGLPII